MALNLNDARHTIDQELEKCREDFEYWATKYVTLIDPRRGDDPVRFESRVDQLRSARLLIDAIEAGRDFELTGPRGAGQSTTAILVAIWFYLFRPCNRFLFVCGRRNDVKRLFREIEGIKSRLPVWMLQAGAIIGGFVDVVAANREVGMMSRYDVIFLEQPETFPDTDASLATVRHMTNCMVKVESTEAPGARDGCQI